jgi:hypothetical protein
MKLTDPTDPDTRVELENRLSRLVTNRTLLMDAYAALGQVNGDSVMAVASPRLQIRSELDLVNEAIRRTERTLGVTS